MSKGTQDQSQEQDVLLQAIYAVFRDSGDWPTYQYVDKALDAAGTDLATLLERIPSGLVVTAHQAGVAPQPGDQVRLALLGVAQAGGADDADLFVRVVRWLAERERSFMPTDASEAEELRLSSEDVENALNARGVPPSPGAVARAWWLIKGEPDIYTALSHSDERSQWEITVSPRIRRFRGIENLDEYLKRRTAPQAQQQPSAGFPFPIVDPEVQIPEATDATHSRLSHLHLYVREAAGALFLDGHLSSAIFEAFKAVEIRVRNLAGIDHSGHSLMARAFRGEDPLLPLNQGASRVDSDEQEGFRLIYMGAMQGIRNPKAHDNSVQDDRDRAYDYLGMASLLMRRLDDAEGSIEQITSS